MSALENLVADIICGAGIKRTDVKVRTALELPGYFRSQKKWDLVVVSEGQLVLAMEFKSQVGPSFGNNFNNRCEEAIGNAADIWTAFREKLFGVGAPAPFLGYLFLLQDCAKVGRPVRNCEPYFKVDPVFNAASYSKRYEVLCRRLTLERMYNAACLILATDEEPTRITQPAEDLTFARFVAALRGHVIAFLETRKAVR